MIHSTFVLGWLWYNYWSNIDGKMNLFHSTFVLGQLITFTFNYKILLSLLYLCHLLCDKIYWTKSIWPTKVLPGIQIPMLANCLSYLQNTYNNLSICTPSSNVQCIVYFEMIKMANIGQKVQSYFGHYIDYKPEPWSCKKVVRKLHFSPNLVRFW